MGAAGSSDILFALDGTLTVTTSGAGGDVFITTLSNGSTSAAATLGNINSGSGGGDNIIISAGGAVTQAASTSITSSTLSLEGTGPFTLTNTTNNVGTLGVNSSNAVSFTDTNALTVGTVTSLSGGSTVGITTAGENVSLTTLNSGTLTISDDVSIGGGTLTITNSGAATQGTGDTIIATNLLLQGSGTVTFTDAGNDFDTVSANAGGAISLTDLDSLSIGTAGGVSGLTTSNDDVSIQTTGALSIDVGGVGLGSGDFLIDTAGGAVTQSTAIVADFLQIEAAGAVTLTNANNDVDTVAVESTGSVSLTDTDTLTLGTVSNGFGTTSGIVSGNDVTLTTGSTLTGTAAPITGDELTISSGGAVTLTNGSTDVNSVTASLSGAGDDFSLFDTDAITISSISTTNGSVTVSSGGAQTITTINAGSGDVTLSATAGSITTPGSSTAILGNALRVTATAGNIGAAGSSLKTDVGSFPTLTAGGTVINVSEAGDINTSSVAVDANGSATVTLTAGANLNYNGDITTSGFDSDDSLVLDVTDPVANSLNLSADMLAGNGLDVTFADPVTLTGSGSTISLGAGSNVVFSSTVDGSATDGASLSVTADNITLNGDVSVDGGSEFIRLSGSGSTIIIALDTVLRTDNLELIGSVRSVPDPNDPTDQTDLTIAPQTFDGRDVVIGPGSAVLGTATLLALNGFDGDLGIGANSSASSITSTNPEFYGNVFITGALILDTTTGSVTVVGLGDITFQGGGQLTAETVNLIALGNDGSAVGLPAGTVSSQGGLVIDDNAGTPTPPGFIDTSNLVVVGGQLGSDSAELGAGLSGTVNGILEVLTANEEAFLDNFGAARSGDGGLSLALADAFNQAFASAGISASSTGFSSIVSASFVGTITTNFTTPTLETGEVATGVSESLFALTSIFILSGNELLVPPQMNPNLPQRPDDPGVEDPQTDEELEINEEWQVFYNEDLVEFLIGEGYVRADENGEVLPEDQALFERYTQLLIDVYEDLRAQEREALAAQLGEDIDFGPAESSEEEGEPEETDAEQEETPDSDEPADTDPDSEDTDTEGTEPQSDTDSSAGFTPANGAREIVGHIGHAWRDGGMGFESRRWRRAVNPWVRFKV